MPSEHVQVVRLVVEDMHSRVPDLQEIDVPGDGAFKHVLTRA